MNVDAPGAVRSGAVRRSRTSAPAAKSGAFSKEITGATAQAAEPVSNTQQLDSVDALLSVQEVKADASGANRRAVDHGEDLLRRLDAIRMGLLAGRMSREDLQAIVRRLSERRQENIDPRLAEILSDIDLRAKVELAKLSML